MLRRALVLGGAATLHEDLTRVRQEKIEYEGVVACNQAGTEWAGPLSAWASIHPIFFYRGISRSWLSERARRGHPPARAIYGPDRRDVPPDSPLRVSPWRIPGEIDRFGSSGLYAVKIALIDLEYDSVLLCGMPLTASPHFDRPDNWKQALAYRQTWEQLTPDTAARIKSMSGWTRQQFGGPE